MAGAGLTNDAWQERVPDLLAHWCDEWGLALGEPYQAGVGGHTVRARLDDGTPAVLKLIFPHRESEHEADALELWDGNGAVRVLARADDGFAVLIERCEPGSPLVDAGPEAALDFLIDVLPRLWVPAGDPIHALAEEAAWWVSYLPQSWDDARPPFDRRLLEVALEALTQLPPTQAEHVLLHQDLHAMNVLAAEREPWLVIDPKPLAGEREFGAAPIVRAFELGHSRRDVLWRFDRLTDELGLDRERTRGWAIGQALAWAFDGPYSRTHLETAQWLLEAA
jgi:streptomycin 6-kinase